MAIKLTPPKALLISLLALGLGSVVSACQSTQVTIVDPVAPDCSPSTLRLTLRWHQVGSGGNPQGLVGDLAAVNPAGDCLIMTKPVVEPLGLQGQPLHVPGAQAHDGHIGLLVQSGQAIHAPVWWTGWCGVTASAQVRVSWGGPSATITVEGQHRRLA